MPENINSGGRPISQDYSRNQSDSELNETSESSIKPAHSEKEIPIQGKQDSDSKTFQKFDLAQRRAEKTYMNTSGDDGVDFTCVSSPESPEKVTSYWADSGIMGEDEIRAQLSMAQEKSIDINEDFESIEKEEADKGIDGKDFDQETCLGTGRFGKVVLIKSRKDGDHFAFKVDSRVDSQLKEYSFMQHIGDHPNIISGHGIAEVGGEKGLVLDYIKGDSLKSVVSTLAHYYQADYFKHSEFWGVIQYLMKGVIEGLSHLNRCGVSHRDIKGQNVMVDSRSLKPVIIDVGSMGYYGETQGVETRFYTPPEGFPESEQDFEPLGDTSDTYAMGQLVYEVVSKLLLPEEREIPFSAGLNYLEMKNRDLRGLIYPLTMAMQKYKSLDPNGDYKTAMTSISKADRLQQPSPQAIEKKRAEQGNQSLDQEAIIEKMGREKMVGRYAEGYESHLVNFINQALHPLSQHRMTADQALAHPFMLDPICDEDDAKELVKYLFQDDLEWEEEEDSDSIDPAPSPDDNKRIPRNLQQEIKAGKPLKLTVQDSFYHRMVEPEIRPFLDSKKGE